MRHVFDGFNHFLRLEKGEQLSATLLEFAAKNKLEGAWVSGIGGAQSATIGYYDLTTKQYRWRDINDLHEVLSLQGNIALNEDAKPRFHLHGIFSDKNFQTIGGHVKDLTVGATLELFIHRSDRVALHRKLDQGIGLPLLDLPHDNA